MYRKDALHREVSTASAYVAPQIDFSRSFYLFFFPEHHQTIYHQAIYFNPYISYCFCFLLSFLEHRCYITVYTCMLGASKVCQQMKWWGVRKIAHNYYLFSPEG